MNVDHWPTVYARAVLGEPFEQLAAEPPNPFGLADVPCMGCLARDRVRRPVADCTCWDGWLDVMARLTGTAS